MLSSRTKVPHYYSWGCACKAQPCYTCQATARAHVATAHDTQWWRDALWVATWE